MAQITFQNVIDQAKVAYPAIDSTLALDYAKAGLREILAMFPEQAEGTETFSSLVAGTREYAMGTTDVMVSVREADYRDSSTDGDYKVLKVVSKEWLDENIPGWEGMIATSDRGSPEYIYIEDQTDNDGTTTRNIGFHPIPDESSSGGYPIVTLYGTKYTEPTGTDTIPISWPSGRSLTAYIKKCYAADHDEDPVREARFHNEYLRELRVLSAALDRQLKDEHSSVTFMHTANQRVV